MSQAVIHRPRVAWDGARAFVSVIQAGQHVWLGEALAQHFGQPLRHFVANSERRINGHPDAVLAETGLWRATLDDLISANPESAAALLEVVQQATARVQPFLAV